MTGRERVNRCLRFDYPDRVPRDLWMLPAASLQHGDEAMAEFRRRWPADILGAPTSTLKQSLKLSGNPYAVGRFTDEWGCTFENVQPGVIGEVKHPLLDDWSNLDLVAPPREQLTVDVEAVNRLCQTSDRFVIAACCPRPFERMQFLRGSQNLLMDLAEEPLSEPLLALLRIVHQFYVQQLEVWCRTRVDAVSFMDDWGSQRALLIRPALWRKLFKPLYADYVRIAHDAGKFAFMHSDGCIFDIYDDLVEIGVDAINSQLFCMNIEAIGERLRRQRRAPITFWGEIDRQHVLPHGSTADVRAAVRHVADHLYHPSGGVIAQYEFGPGTPLANASAVFEAWDEISSAAAGTAM